MESQTVENLVPEDMLLRYLTTEEKELAVKAGFSARTGLRWTLEELSTLTVDPRKYEMEDIAKYVDAITFIKVRQNDVLFFDSMLGPLPPSSSLEGRISMTGLGNIAYVAVHMEDPTIRSRAATLYNQILVSLISEK